MKTHYHTFFSEYKHYCSLICAQIGMRAFMKEYYENM